MAVWPAARPHPAWTNLSNFRAFREDLAGMADLAGVFPAGQIGQGSRYRKLAQKRWMRAQASSSTSVEVA